MHNFCLFLENGQHQYGDSEDENDHGTVKEKKSNDNNKESGKAILYLQVPFFVLLVALIYVGWRCAQRRRVNHKERFIGSDEIPLSQSM